MTTRPDVSKFDQRVVLYDKTWADYDAQLAIRGEERSRPKLAFLAGALELMSPSSDHERIKWHIGQILAFYCAEAGIPMCGYGQWTLRDRAEDAGAEPDECYIFGTEQRGRSRPDLVIEVVWTHGGIKKLEIYRRLGVREVWFWDDDQISVHVMGDAGYEVRARSTFVPDLDLEGVCRLANGEPRPVTELQRDVRAILVRGR
ncbi:MAG: Uma2 family endonuclease [Deltaproteobacteria bacterium]|nr:Uma2 family endonuclease [Deltaproteobacteria bacterium]